MTQEPERDRVLSEEDFLNAIAYAGIETTDFNRVVAHDAALRTLIGELVGALEYSNEFLEWAQANVPGTNTDTYTILNRAAIARVKEAGLS